MAPAWCVLLCSGLSVPACLSLPPAAASCAALYPPWQSQLLAGWRQVPGGYVGARTATSAALPTFPPADVAGEPTLGRMVPPRLPLQWYSYSANVTGLLRVKACSAGFGPSVVIRTDAFSSSGGGIAQLPGCGSCDIPLV